MTAWPIRLVTTALIAVWAANAAAAPLRCNISEKHVCIAKKGCSSTKPTVWNLVDLAASKYSRCDRQGCDTYNADISRSGIFLNIVIPRRGVLAKMVFDGSSFLEVMTATDVVYISFGSCSEQ